MRRKARKGGARQVEVTVTAIGARGDGIAEVEGRPLFLPQTLAGDRVLARVTGQRAGAHKGEVIELLAEGPGRQEAPCPQFGPCGGCALQHLEQELYRNWKAALLRQALARRGFSDTPVRPLVTVPPGSRRRVTLAAQRGKGGAVVGFHGRESHKVVDAAGCLIMRPALAALLPGLRAALPAVLTAGAAADLYLCETECGIDLLIESPRERRTWRRGRPWRPWPGRRIWHGSPGARAAVRPSRWRSTGCPS